MELNNKNNIKNIINQRKIALVKQTNVVNNINYIKCFHL